MSGLELGAVLFFFAWLIYLLIPNSKAHTCEPVTICKHCKREIADVNMLPRGKEKIHIAESKSQLKRLTAQGVKAKLKGENIDGEEDTLP